MSSADQKEIIFTPEAKGSRLLPSSKGFSVNFSRLNQKREIKLKTPRSTPLGRIEDQARYTKLKEEAQFSEVSADSLLFLQSDPQGTAMSFDEQKLRATGDFAGLDDTSWTPPNSQIAVGPSHLLVAVNTALAIFDKTGRQILRVNLADIFSQLVQDAIIFSPRVVYDQFREGWMIAACARSVDERHSWFLLAYSTGASPLGEWFTWALDAGFDGKIRTGHWADDIGLSVDNNSVYLTANMFNAKGRFLYSKLRIVNKKEMQSGGILHGWDFWELRNADGSLAFGVQPALNLRATDTQYLLNTTSDGQGVTQWSVTHALRHDPLLKRRFIATPGFQLAPNVKQFLSDVEIETGDTRLTNVVFRNGMLWAAHTVAADWGNDSNVAAIHWLQINARAGFVAQQGIYGAAHFHYFCPAVTPDGESNLLIVFNRAGESEFPSIRYAGRLASDEPNTLQASALLQQSLTAGAAEWSTRNGVACAPDGSAIWMIGQYAATDEDWATWIGAATYAEPDVQIIELRFDGTNYG
ncbi:MAG: hypothetical protein JMDDDDMK_01539 [Acidobacteria bacterium]|nr:hypothetical protein [Acidobacteriota bacterium]